MKHQVGVEVGCTKIVTVDNWCPSRGEVELPEEIRYPTELGSCGSGRSVFDFSGGPSNCTLFLGTSRDEIAIEMDNEGTGGGKIILVASLVSVRVCM